jgi:hypothetical protein
MPLKAPQFILEDDLWWTTQVELPSWKGFQSRKGAYAAREDASASDGFVPIVFAPEGRGNQPLTDPEISLVVWVIENEAALASAAISSLLQEYPSLQKLYGYSGKEKADLMPDIKSADDLRGLIGLHAVNIHPVVKDGIPYVGFELGCNWDDEHGLGILVHGTRTVEIGGADSAILQWVAERDARNSP